MVRFLSERLKGLNERLPLVRVVLFGSYAKGNYTAASDIDLLVVYRDERREDAYSLVKRVLDLPGLEPHVYPKWSTRRSNEPFKRCLKMTSSSCLPMAPQDGQGLSTQMGRVACPTAPGQGAGFETANALSEIRSHGPENWRLGSSHKQGTRVLPAGGSPGLWYCRRKQQPYKGFLEWATRTLGRG